MGTLVVVKRESNLLKVILALGTSGGFASGLNRRQQHRHQNADNRNHNQ